uniref:Putative secreted protein n=1 Tax=Anopheles marajoara TaxID=58244 RepID=A0A2M4CBT6_9DIPT
MSTDTLLYFLLIFVPSVMKRSRNVPNAQDHASASRLNWECRWTESFSHSTLRNASSSNVITNTADTITSTEFCGPRRFK